MHKFMLFFGLFLGGTLWQPAFAQQPSQKTLDSLTLALAQDEEFIAFNLETIRHGEKIVDERLTTAESKAFTQQQMARLKNIGNRFPEISQLDENLRASVRQKASKIALILRQEEIDQIKQTSRR